MADSKNYKKINDTMQTAFDLCDQFDKELNNFRAEIVELNSVETKSDRGTFDERIGDLITLQSRLTDIGIAVDECRKELLYQIQHYDFTHREEK